LFAEAEVAATEAEAARVEAESVVTQARGALARVENEHRAHAIAGTLEVGSDCPVCGHVIDETPSVARPGDLAAAEAGLVVAVANERRIPAAGAAAAARREAIVGVVAQIDQDLAECRRRLEGQADAASVEVALAEITEGDKRVRAARDALRSAGRRLDDARQRLEAIHRGETQWRRKLSSLRDTLMAVDPPEIAGADLGADWRDFVSWAASRSETLVAESAVQRDEIAGLEARLTHLASAVTNAMGQMGLAGEGTPHAETVAAAIGYCRQQLERIRHDLEMKAEAERG
jgi:hypothetical protein